MSRSSRPLRMRWWRWRVFRRWGSRWGVSVTARSMPDCLTGFLPRKPEILARLLSSPLAQRKGVGDRPYAVLLNQADAAPPGGADAVAAFLLQNGVQRVVAAALQHRPGEYHVWTR